MEDTSQDRYAAERARYKELYDRSKARRRDFSEAKGNPPVLPDILIKKRETLPGGWGASFRMARGESLRLINTQATPGISLLLFNAEDASERLNPGDTVKIQWSARLHKGKLLYSDMGRVLASMTDDSCGKHDALTGGSTSLTNEARYGDASLRNTRDNFILLAAKHGLSKVDIGPCLTLFAPVSVNADSKLVWEDALSPGQYVDLRAEMDILIFLSNCPHPLASGDFDPKPIELLFWKSPPAAEDDFCRTASEEAERGFDNTDAYMTGGRS